MHGLVIPKSDLNISRALMPQINSKDVPDFLKYLWNTYKIKAQNKKVPLQKVKPSQGEFNPEKIAAMMQKNLADDKPAIMSNDNYILDGHHRYAADLNNNPKGKFNVYWINMPFMDLIQAARTYAKSYTKEIHETINTNMDEDLLGATHIVEGILNEGINDPGIFKAIFIAGGPGSGKDFIVKKLLANSPLVEINSDIAFEFGMKKAGLSPLMPDAERNPRDEVRGRSKKTTETKEMLALKGRLGLIINGTGSNRYGYLEKKQALEAMGYETAMIYVNTSNEVSRQRNIERGQRGGRSVPEKLRQDKYDEAQDNLGFYQQNFDRFIIVDNTKYEHQVDEKTKAEMQANWSRIYKFYRAFINTPVNNKRARQWIETEMAKQGVSQWKAPKAPRFGNQGSMARFESIEYNTEEYKALKADIASFSRKELEVLAECENPVVSTLAKHRLI